jgi:hypothetical protein
MGVSLTWSSGIYSRAWSTSDFKWSGPTSSGFSPNVETPVMMHQSLCVCVAGVKATNLA